ncbi:MAG: phosphoribosylformylglycinamidine synthase [Cyanobacteria bacterium SZAS LIN-3]|nr:phosphoribosylformylglycinamidine synthase [Cyanobacteria bacterium SZAS LIN-3]
MTVPSKSTTQLKDSMGQTSALSRVVVAVRPREKPESFALYWIVFPSADQSIGEREREIIAAVLADELIDQVWLEEQGARAAGWQQKFIDEGYSWFAEKQYLPGVTDNLAHTIEEALHLKGFPEGTRVCSGHGYLLKSEAGRTAESLMQDACYKLYHPLTEKFVVHALNADASADYLLFPERAQAISHSFEYVDLNVDDQALMKLSSEKLLALSLAEMKAVQEHFFQSDSPINQSGRDRQEAGLQASPTDVELEVIAQTWSEHCKHKIFGAAIVHHEFDQDGCEKPTRTVHVDSLYKTYIQGPTHELMHKRDDLLSVFEDNSGVVKWSDKQAVCFKVETHNSPSALEPYGGALTGILGVNRDILGTGLGARPIFNTDVFCFAYPSDKLPQRPKLLPAKTILDGVRLGVEDGGNKSGIPTVNGAVYFHDGYRAKPLVFCGTGGILPLAVAGEKGYLKHTKVGDRIVMAGGRVGKDGVHGATFSSESLNENSPAQAVQIGDPFTQKRLMDFVLEARDLGLITGLTDNGAGGLSSSIGEMATITGGATIELQNIPLKYPGLADWEIVVSESQERMSLSTRDFAALEALARKHSVEVTNIGEFTDDGYFRVLRGGKTIALLNLHFLHKGAPRLELTSRYVAHYSDTAHVSEGAGGLTAPDNLDHKATLLKLLAHPNICSREKIIRRYDHEVQGGSVIKPLMGPAQMAPCDSAVIMPDPGDRQGLVVSNGLCPQLSQFDGWLMAVCAVDEAVRNQVCVGADPASITLLDNFCWTDPVPGPRNPQAEEKLAILVRACMGLADICRAYGAPLISGKDSMKNDFDDGVIRLSVPPTLLVSAMGKIGDAANAISMEFKQAGDLIYLLSAGSPALAASVLTEVAELHCDRAVKLRLPALNIEAAARMYRALYELIAEGLVHSAHDLSEGGLLVALAESVLGSSCGADIKIENELVGASLGEAPALFGEGPGRIIISIPADAASALEKAIMEIPGARLWELGVVTAGGGLEVAIEGLPESAPSGGFSTTTEELRRAWTTALPFD